MGIKVIKPGLQTTVQDLGRFGFRKDGIIVSGAMDTLALEIGNLLLGNDSGEAALECTLMGPKLLFETDQLIALTGGDLSPAIDGLPVKMWKPLFVTKGSVLSFGAAVTGCRTYITIYGGFDLPLILGSKSTYLKAGFGGYEGRMLKSDDLLHFNKNFKRNNARFNWLPDLSWYPDLNDPEIRVTEGPEYRWFSENESGRLFTDDYEVTKEADRMGYRLSGQAILVSNSRQMLSTAVGFGTVQVTGDGGLIALMADHQTTGGYPRVLQVIGADLPKLAQMKSGRKIRFKLVDLETAVAALSARKDLVKQLKQTINLKYL
ncbi:MAG: biotin-dependent carboxyltransferase family protein [Bacteroidota bacterium]